MAKARQPIPKNIRLKGAVVCESVLRLFRLITDHYGGDLESFVVYLAVVSAAGTSRLLRSPELRERYGTETPLPTELMTPISRRAISESVGLPRETVRRKIAALIEQGHLEEANGRVRAVAPVLEHGPNLEFVIAAARELQRAAAELQRCEDA